MKCKICGRELKGKGNICKNCYNEKQKQKAIEKDKSIVYELNSTYKPGYELLKILDALIIGIIIIMSVMIYNNILMDIVTIVLLLAMLIGWLTYRRNKVNQTNLTFYETKVVFKSKDKEKTLLYKDLNDLGYYQNWKQKTCKTGEIRLLPANSIIVLQGINMPDVDNVVEEFENVKDIIRERINVDVDE